MNPAIAPYPPPFNRKLEEAYHRYEPGNPATERCALGADFFNSTIFFQTQGEVRESAGGDVAAVGALCCDSAEHATRAC